MEQKGVIRNVASTALVLGLTLSTAGSTTSTMLVNGSNFSMGNYSEYDYAQNFQVNSALSQYNSDNIYIRSGSRNIEKVANELFGNMRDATEQENESIERYIRSISKSTGVNFFDLC